MRVKKLYLLEFSNIRRCERIWHVCQALATSALSLFSDSLAKPGRTSNPVQMNRAVDAAAVARGDQNHHA